VETVIGEMREFFWDMPQTPHAFEWVDYDAYVSTNAGCEQQGFVTLAVRGGAKFVRKNVFDGSVALYRTFADTDPSKDAILSFANRYGMMQCDVRALLQQQGRQCAGIAEALELWLHWLLIIHESVRIWDLGIKENRRELTKSFEHRADGFYYLMPRHTASRFGTRLSTEVETPVSTQICLGLFEAPIAEVGLVDAALIWALRNVSSLMGWVNVQRVPRRDAKRRAFVYLKDEPVNLLGAIALQLALAIQNATPSKRCKGCGRWFEVAPDKNRKDRLTCSGTCRNRLHLNRRSQARELQAEGKTLKQIAKQLGSEEKIVRTWIRNTEE
jgi:hypothetical protein